MRCEVCGEPATVHVTHPREPSSQHLCAAHARAFELPMSNVPPARDAAAANSPGSRVAAGLKSDLASLRRRTYERLIDALERVRRDPGATLERVDVPCARAFLAGCYAVLATRLHPDAADRNAALAARGYDCDFADLHRHLQDRNMTDPAIIDLLLAVEIDALRRRAEAQA